VKGAPRARSNHVRSMLAGGPVGAAYDATVHSVVTGGTVDVLEVVRSSGARPRPVAT
jgi:hypothetical protein